jgi:NAD/NADP transhydrogenase beta subunit
MDELYTPPIALAFLVAAVLFILALRGLSNQESAKRGNLFGIVGMAIAIAATLLIPGFKIHWLIVLAIVGGGALGVFMAVRVGMTQMPELVALLHSFVGVAAVLVGYALQLDAAGHLDLTHKIEIYIDVIIGAITVTGSILAFLKLRGSVSGKPLLLPARHVLNLAMLATIVVAGALYGDGGQTWALAIGTAVACRARRAPGRGHRRRRHAGRGLDAQQLLGLDRGRRRLHAEQRPAHRHRRAGRQLGRDPQLHHVPGDEPVDLERDLRRLRRR